jgi:hypothetical protein
MVGVGFSAMNAFWKSFRRFKLNLTQKASFFNTLDLTGEVGGVARLLLIRCEQPVISRQRFSLVVALFKYQGAGITGVAGVGSAGVLLE